MTAEVKIAGGPAVWSRMLAGFIAGFLATLTFHQLTVVILKTVYAAPLNAFSLQPTNPFGVAAVFSLAFWGGIWGIIYALLHHRFPGGAGYWLSAFLFGAIFPTLIALLIVLPLKGQPLGGGLNPGLWITAFLVNGAWGLGTGVFLTLVFPGYAGTAGRRP